MTLAGILGYRLDMVRCAAVRSLHRRLADHPLRPAEITALLLVRDEPGCDQTMLGRAVAGNRSVGMKIASRLEARGLMKRRQGRDRRSKGLFLTRPGREMLARVLRDHERAEALLATHLSAGERTLLLALLAKVERAVLEEEEALSAQARPPASAAMGQGPEDHAS